MAKQPCLNMYVCYGITLCEMLTILTNITTHFTVVLNEFTCFHVTLFLLQIFTNIKSKSRQSSTNPTQEIRCPVLLTTNVSTVNISTLFPRNKVLEFHLKKVPLGFTEKQQLTGRIFKLKLMWSITILTSSALTAYLTFHIWHNTQSSYSHKLYTWEITSSSLYCKVKTLQSIIPFPP